MKRAWLWILLIGVLTGCGFKLRGPADLPYRAVKISGHPFEPVVRELNHQLKMSKTVLLVDRLEDAEMVIDILQTERDEEILSLGRTGHVQAYEYLLWVRYQICGPQGRQCQDEAIIELRRDMSYDESRILAKQNEEQLLQRDMNQEAARLILLNASAFRINNNENASSVAPLPPVELPRI